MFADWIQVGRMDELAGSDSPVHRLDARGKVVTTVAFIIAVMSFPRHEVSALTPFLAYPVVIVSLGRIPLWFLLRKVLLAAPFAAVVGMFNPLLDRQPMAVVAGVVVTGGWLSFASIMFRFVLTAWAALALIACTGMHRLAAALAQLGVPRVFVVQHMFLHRYLFVIADNAVKMMRSAAARSGGRALTFKAYASMIGHLLVRSMDRAERVHRAMAARGYDGELRTVRRAQFGLRDAMFVGCCLAFFAAARVWNVPAFLGRLASGG